MFSILDELFHWFEAINQILRTAGEIGHGCRCDVDAEVMIKGGEDFAELDGAIHGFTSEAIGGADDLTRFHSAASEQGAGDPRPMVASAIFVDRRSAAELAPDDNRNIFFKTAIINVIDQGGQTLVEQWEILTERAEIIAVMIPTAERESDAA